MKRKTITILVILLLTGNMLTHLWGWLPAQWTNEQFNIFLKPGFDLKISFAWYVKELTDDLNMAIIFVVMAIIAEKQSHLLFVILSIFFMYYIIDAFLLIWNFKQTKEIYWISSLLLIISIVLLLREPKMRMVK